MAIRTFRTQVLETLLCRQLGVVTKRNLSTDLQQFRYVQGQYNAQDQKIREYFYVIDHNGQLFLDDARMKNFTSCFKEVKFLRFFYSRIRRTDENQSNNVHLHFRYTSHCGPERNYIRVNATPFVFTSVVDGHRELEYNNTGLTQEFLPKSLFVGSDGRLYHAFKHKHADFALIKSSVADLMSLNFEYDEGSEDGKRPVRYRANDGQVHTLDYSLREVVERELLTRGGGSVEEHGSSH